MVRQSSSITFLVDPFIRIGSNEKNIPIKKSTSIHYRLY